MTTKQARVLEALLVSPSKSEAARMAKVDRETITRMLADPVFHAEYDRRREDALQVACAALQSTLQAAVDTLAQIMQDTENPPSSRIYAARTVLEYGIKLTEQVDILQRLEAVEQAMQEGKP